VILHPNIIALLVSSLLISGMVLASALVGGRIIRHWDISSGSEKQLDLERQTYLISTILGYFLPLQLASLFLFIYTTDSLCSLFTGAMCAVGTLTVNDYGYPTLVLKTVNFICAGLWLILNYSDNKGYDYPLIRTKYLLLLAMAPFVLAETVVQLRYFLGLIPDIITSCCGSLFSTVSPTLASDIAALPPREMTIAFYGVTLASCAVGIRFSACGKGAALFAFLSGTNLFVSLLALISFISLYIYQMPSHHCPFCILQKEYNFIGYPLYLSLLTAAVCGMGSGLLQPFRRIESLADSLPPFQRKLALVAVGATLVFAGIASCYIVFTDFRLAD
jgi:hypothetical protein